MANVNETRCWRLPVGAELEWRHWGDEYVVYHSLSNDTHQVSELAGRLLSALGRSDRLDSSSLAVECELSQDEIGEILAVLSQLDLVAQC